MKAGLVRPAREKQEHAANCDIRDDDRVSWEEREHGDMVKGHGTSLTILWLEKLGRRVVVLQSGA